jgi:hypothetical protein
VIHHGKKVLITLFPPFFGSTAYKSKLLVTPNSQLESLADSPKKEICPLPLKREDGKDFILQVASLFVGAAVWQSLPKQHLPRFSTWADELAPYFGEDFRIG